MDKNSTNKNSKKVSSALALMVENFERLIKSGIDSAPYDTTYRGIITDIKFNDDTPISNSNYNKYTVKFNLLERDFIINDGKLHVVGENVIVHIPNNVLTDRYVECIDNFKSHPISISYDNETDTLTEVWGENLSRIFVFTVENKGEDNETVTKMTFPDGSEMSLEGF